MVNGQAVHGLMHPEAGHLCLKRMPGDDFAGVDNTFGGASVEGLASTVALAARKASEPKSPFQNCYTKYVVPFIYKCTRHFCVYCRKPEVTCELLSDVSGPLQPAAQQYLADSKAKQVPIQQA